MKRRVLESENSCAVVLFWRDSNRGLALVIVAAFMLIFILLGYSLLGMVNNDRALIHSDVNKTQAFYLAEAGLGVFSANAGQRIFVSIGETVLGDGSHRVDYYTDDPNADYPYAIATSTVKEQEKQIKVDVLFLAPPYDCCIYAGGVSGTPWTLIMRGTGTPVPAGPREEAGGRYTVNGNVFVNGNVALYEDSSVNPAPLPNTYNLQGDVDATGNINVYDAATIAGDINEGSPPYGLPDIVGMNYAVNNTHNVSQIFAGQTLDWRGRPPGLPRGTGLIFEGTTNWREV